MNNTTKTSDLEHYFNNNQGRLIHKWQHYFEAYEHHFARFREQEIVILEIGIFHGGSLDMWRNYFGDKVRIYGIDINPQCKELEKEGVEIFIGSQSDRTFLNEIKAKIPKVDILIDDGGHRMLQQIISFEVLFDHVKDNGIYLCEDLHTSYWLEYGGGHKRRRTFIEYSKNFIDKIHAFHSDQSSLKVDSFTESVKSLHYYDSILVIEKGRRTAPADLKSGTPSYTIEEPPISALEKMRRPIFKLINKILRFFRLPWK